MSKLYRDDRPRHPSPNIGITQNSIEFFVKLRDDHSGRAFRRSISYQVIAS
jgi:hypothetical protein